VTDPYASIFGPASPQTTPMAPPLTPKDTPAPPSTTADPYASIFTSAPAPAQPASPTGLPPSPTGGGTPAPSGEESLATPGGVLKHAAFGPIRSLSDTPAGMANLVETGLWEKLHPFSNPDTGESYFKQLGRDLGMVSTPAPEGQGYQPVSGPLLQKAQSAVGLNANDYLPRPANGPERVAEGITSAAASLVLPEALVSRAGILGPGAKAALEPVLGSGTTQSMLANARLGAAAGAGSSLAQEVVPDKYKPLAGLVGTGLGLGAAAVPGILGKAAGVAVPPVTTAGKRIAVGRDLIKAADNPQAIIGDTGPVTDKRILPESPQSLGEAYSDPGLQGLQGRIAGPTTKEGADLAEQQQRARVEALTGAGRGDATSLPQLFRDQAAKIEQDTQAALQRQAQAADQAKAAVGIGGLKEAKVGAAGRSVLEDMDTAEKARMKGLYDAAEANGPVNVLTSGVQEAKAKAYDSLNPTAQKTLDPIEKTITAHIDTLGPQIPLSELGSLKSWISAEMRKMDNTAMPYQRMGELRKGVDSSIDDTLAKVDDLERTAVANGTLAPDDTTAARIKKVVDEYNRPASETDTGRNEPARAVAAAGPAPSPVEGSAGAKRLSNGAGDQGLREFGTPPAPAAAQTGPVGAGRLHYPGGAVDVRYELADLADLKTSHDADFRANPDYPAELQPRDRSGYAAQDQVNQMANGLQPERLGRSSEINAGAPLVGPDNVVESGNGRTLALAQRYAKGNNEAYRQWLQAQGYDVSGYQRPVLIARRTTALSPKAREYMTGSAALNQGLGRSGVEKAASDAKLLGDDVLQRARGGDLLSEENGDFVRAFMAKLPANERADLVDAKGALTKPGRDRINAALTMKAFGDRSVIEQAFATPDPTVRSIANGMVKAAPIWAKMREAAKAGGIAADHDITDALLTDLHAVMQARAKGFSAQSILDQASLLGEDAAAHDLLFSQTKAGTRLAGEQKIADNLQRYAENALKNTAGDRLFGEALPAKDVLKATVDKLGKEGEEAAPSFATGAGETAGPELASRQQLEGLRKADAEYKAFMERKRPVKGLLQRAPYKTSPYKITDDSLPDHLWKSGASGANAINDYVAFTGKSKTGLDALESAAALSLQRKLGQDGRLSPAKYDRWRADHDSAIQAMEQARPGFLARFDSYAGAERAMEEAVTTRRALADGFAKSEAGKIMHLTAGADVAKKLGQILEGQGGVGKLQELMRATHGNADAIEGLRQGVLDHIFNRQTGTKSLSDSELALKEKEFRDYVRKHQAGLQAVLAPDQLARVNAVAEDMARSARTRELGKVEEPGAQPAGGTLKRAFQNYAQKDLTSKMFAGLGWLIGGVPAAGVGYSIGELRKAGFASVEQLKREAILNPEMGRTFMQMAHAKDAGMTGLGLRTKLLRAALAGSHVQNQGPAQPAG